MVMAFSRSMTDAIVTLIGSRCATPCAANCSLCQSFTNVLAPMLACIVCTTSSMGSQASWCTSGERAAFSASLSPAHSPLRSEAPASVAALCRAALVAATSSSFSHGFSSACATKFTLAPTATRQ